MATTAPERKFTVVQASFIGVGAMVGAGIFALLGAAGAVAGSAVWLSFLVALVDLLWTRTRDHRRAQTQAA